MSASYFNENYVPVPSRGLTPLEAVELMRREFSGVSSWTCWRPGYASCRGLGVITGTGNQAAGKIGGWSWTRVSTSYPQLLLWDGLGADAVCAASWVGVLKIVGSAGEEFWLFSYLNSVGVIGRSFLVSTADTDLLDRFSRELGESLRAADEVVVQVHGSSRDICLDANAEEMMFLPDRLRADIEEQIRWFYESAAQFRQLRIPHRRGLLLVGAPGVGKSLLLRHLARHCYRRYRTAVLMLSLTKQTQEHEISMVFESAAQQAPALVIIEDVDALNEAQIGRANFLGCLDGLEARAGILVVGTTNHPEAIDPALIHRPSRFDRVFTLPLPDENLRRKYIRWVLPESSVELQSTIVRQTQNWSFAFLNELRTTIVLKSLERGDASPVEQLILEALELLSRQFQAGRSNHVLDAGNGRMGFGDA